MEHTFKKGERISSQREIDLLFDEGSSFMVYPIRVIYVEKKPFSGMFSAVLISVSKKRFKHAVKRNRMKRLIREAYRLNKHPFLEFLKEKNKGILTAFLYVGNEFATYADIEVAMKKALNNLQQRLS